MKSLTVTLPDKETVSIQLYAAAKSTAPVLLFFPAMGVRAEFYKPFAATLTQAGITFVTADLRGLGTSSVRPSSKVDFGYKEMIEDVEVIVRQVKELFPIQLFYIGGHSLGGQIASLYVGKKTELVSGLAESASGLVLIAACSIYYKGWQGRERLKTRMGITFFPMLSKLFGYFPGDKVGFGGKGARTMLLDWAHVGKTSKYEVIGDSFDYEKAMANTNISIFAAAIERDWMAPRLAIQHLYRKFHSDSPVKEFMLTKAATDQSLNHFKWVKYGEALVEELKGWMLDS